MSQTPITFRPADEEQLRRFKLLTFFLGGRPSHALREAVDALYDKHAEDIEAIKPQYDAAQAALAKARQAVQAKQGGIER